MSKTSKKSEQRPQQHLRRAKYIHVSDLISSFYNFDNEQLESELARVNMERENPAAEECGNRRAASVYAELDTGASQKRLQAPKDGFNICCLVGKVTAIENKKRVDGSQIRLAEVEVGDETGAVLLLAREEQVDILQEVSDRSGAIVLRNCTLELFRGKRIRLSITKWGKLSTYPDKVASTPPPPSQINRERNFSLIDLTLVASNIEEFPPNNSYGRRDSSDSEVQLNMGGQNSYHSGHQPHDRSRRSRGRGQFSRSTSNNAASALSSLALNDPSNQQGHMLLQQQFMQKQIQMEQMFSGHYGQPPHTRFVPGSNPSVPVQQPLYVIEERPCWSPNVKAEWPELVGIPASDAEAAILAETNFGVEVIVVHEGSFVAMDYRMDRVWLWVDDGNRVAREPTLG